MSVGGPENLSPLCLAYLGDAVFELHVRGMLLSEGATQVDKLHKKARGFVNAAAQARMYFKLLPLLTGEELEVMKRGRNAKSATKAKNASIADYRHATGVEALFGYLYLRGENDRLLRLFEACLSDDGDGVKKEDEHD